MSIWPSAALGEVATIVRDGVEPSRIHDGTLYVGLENIRSGGDLVDVAPVARGDLASTKFRFTQRQVLYGKLRPYLAKVARPHFDGICSTDILPILPGERLDRDYLTHFLLRPESVSWAASHSTGANLPRLSPTSLALMRVPLPPVEEQRRIADLLDRAEALRVKRRAAFALSIALAGSLFDATCGRMAPRGRGWKVGPLRDVVSLLQIGPFGSLLHESDYVTGGVPIVNPTHIQAGHIVPNPEFTVALSTHARLAQYQMKAGDIVMGRRGEMGRCAVVQPDEDGYLCGTGSLFIRPQPGVTTSGFLVALLASRSVKRSLERVALGATLPNLNSTIVEAIEVAVPPIEVQAAFDRQMESVDDIERTLRVSAKGLNQLFDALQSRAFSGQL